MLAAWQIPERDVNWGKRLAEGAYGEVWSARWAAHDVAIKILKKSLEDELYPEAEEDFKRECLTLQSIRHPHLLIFYGAGVTDGEIRPFMVTEFMMVGSLRTLLRNTDGVELSWEQRRTMAMQIGEGMQHLHSLKIVHRDLKSDNCLVGNDGDEFIIKVADFGNSRLLREQAEPEEEAPETAYDKLRKKRNMQTAYMNPLCEAALPAPSPTVSPRPTALCCSAAPPRSPAPSHVNPLILPHARQPPMGVTFFFFLSYFSSPGSLFSSFFLSYFFLAHTFLRLPPPHCRRCRRLSWHPRGWLGRAQRQPGPDVRDGPEPGVGLRRCVRGRRCDLERQAADDRRDRQRR